MAALYIEIDENAAAWLRNLIAEGVIAPGDVTTRSIEDVTPAELAAYTQVHAFAGIGVWSYALRLAGWPDDRPVWTASCPCQPFSAAGKGDGFADERHLWPHFFHLARVCRPPVIHLEQVASKDGLAWIDVVSADLEGEAYAVWAGDRCSAGVESPHIRQRLYGTAVDASNGLADAPGLGRWTGLRDFEPPGFGRALARHSSSSSRLGGDVGLGHAERRGRPRGESLLGEGGGTPCGERGEQTARFTGPGHESGMGDAGRELHECVRGPGEVFGTLISPGGEAQQRERRRPTDRSDVSSGGLAFADDGERGRLTVVAGRDLGDRPPAGRVEGDREPGPCVEHGGLADALRHGAGSETGSRDCPEGAPEGDQWGPPGTIAASGQRCLSERLASGTGVGLADAEGRGRRECGDALEPRQGGHPDGGSDASGSLVHRGRPRAPYGGWGDADWLFCRDGKWRPVEPGTFPLAHAAPARVGRLRAYGNAIDAENAREHIEIYLEAESAGFDLRHGGLIPEDVAGTREPVGSLGTR